ncbi:MAG: helix-turn-helix domain-containing protein, partial [Candidatus Gracilibacteria bacterium]
MVYNRVVFEEILIKNGFTSKEAAFYLSVLEAGELTFARAAEKAHLKRSTVYSLVEGLREKNIVSITKKKGISYVSALSPKLLVEHFENSAAMAKSVLPQLMNLSYTSPVKPRIHFYEGMDGIKQILFEAAASKADYIGFIDYTLMPKEIYKYIRTKVAPERAKWNTNLRLLMPENPTNKNVLKDYK